MSIFKKVKKAVSKVTKPVAKAVEKIAQGKVAEGLGDIGQTGARMGLDIATGGNKDLVDGFSGGLLTSAENAARGNTKDIARVGVTGAATFAGGPTAGFAVNNVLSNGGSITQAALAAGSGGDMSFLSDVSGFLGNNPGIAQLANSALSGLGPKSAPKVVQSAPAIQTIEVPSARGMSMGMMVGIGSAVIGAIVLILVVVKRK